MKLLVVDGNSILNRAYYGIRPLTTKDGMFTNAIYGFLTMLEKIKADTEPNRVAIAFDLKAKTFRHKAYDLYKANRKGMPDELHMQLQPLKDPHKYSHRKEASWTQAVLWQHPSQYCHALRAHGISIRLTHSGMHHSV